VKRGKPLARKKPMRRGKPLRSKGKGKYARRERDLAYMKLVKTLPCAVSATPTRWTRIAPALCTLCTGEVQADHAGSRAMGRKCPDDETIPLCRKHHRERTDLRGAFKGWDRIEMRRWCDYVIRITQQAIAEKRWRPGDKA
jgi:hypothetical protein